MRAVWSGKMVGSSDIRRNCGKWIGGTGITLVSGDGEAEGNLNPNERHLESYPGFRMDKETRGPGVGLCRPSWVLGGQQA